MNQLIRIETNDNLEQLVCARELHEALGINKDFTNWFKYQIEKLGLIEGLDFTPILAKTSETGGRPKTDFHVTIDIAKHIAMISGGENGRKVREYFIQVEKAWNDPDQIMARALQISNRKLLNFTERVTELETKIEEDRPKVIFADAHAVSGNNILVGELAKILKQNGIEVGQNRLFDHLRDKGYLIKQKGEQYNMPAQKSLELDLMVIKKTVQTNPDGSTRVNRTTKITPKGQQYFVNKFLDGDLV